jgi:hypothetical protein
MDFSVLATHVWGWSIVYIIRNRRFRVHRNRKNIRSGNECKFYIRGNFFTTACWSLERQVNNQDLKTLFNNLHNTIINSRAKNTVSKYIGSFKRYMSWAEHYKEIDSVLPSSELHVALYLQYIMGTVKYHSTIENAFYVIK